jgi:guanine deaminase
MKKDGFINILVAEDNELSRELISGVLRTQGYRVYGAIDGQSAIKVTEDRDIDMAFIDVNMAPSGGFDFIRHLVVNSIDIPVVIITADDSSHILMEATALGVAQVIQKPIEPDKILRIAYRILSRRGLNPKPLGVDAIETRFSPEDLMKKAIALAEKNARTKGGGPFGAVIADREGRILGEGVNGITSRADPAAHAEIMAIRQAAGRLGRSDLSDCVLYCSSEPTAVGKAMIESVSIGKVYYGLRGDEVKWGTQKTKTTLEYKQICYDEAAAMFKNFVSQ